MNSSNPYASHPNPYAPDPIYAADDLLIRRIAIDPIALLSKSYALIRNQYWLFLGIVLTGLSLGYLGPMGLLMGPCMVGIYLSFIQCEIGQRVEFGTLFKGFEFFLDSFIVVLIIAGISLLVIVPLFIFLLLVFLICFATVLNPAEELAQEVILWLGLFGTCAAIFSSTLIATPLLFAFPLIADRGLSGGQAVWVGWQGVKANFFGICWFMFVIMIISMICASMCCLPVILFMPISMGAQYMLYREVFGPNPMLGVPNAED